MKVSVVMATFNGERHLAEQLESIIRNTHPPDEIVIVDDASTDGTAGSSARILAGAAGIPFKVLRNDRNMGPTASFARAVMNSTGDVLLFSDQDDFWMPEKIAMIMEAFGQTSRPVMVYHDGQITDDALRPTGRSIFGTRHGGQLARGPLRDPMDIARNPDIKGCTMALDGAFARQLFGSSVSGFDRYWGHDHWAALFAFGTGKVQVLGRSLILHRFHASNTSSGMRFDLLRPATLKRYLKAMRHQATDHFVQRYRIALEQVDHGGTPFSNQLREALSAYLDMALQRHALHGMGTIGRIRAALALHRDGIYRTYFNGWATLLRDLLAR